MNNRFEKRFRNVPASLWRKIAQIEALKGQWVGGAHLSPQILGRLKKSVLITSAGASTRIEGAKLSDVDVESLMRGLSVKRFADRDRQEVRGYYELLQTVFDSWKSVSFSESTIKHFHKELLKYAGKDERHRGDYKKGENRVEAFDSSGKAVGVVFETTPAYLTPKQMQELAEWTKEALAGGEHHPLLVIGNFIVEFLKIHPFQDGNGRLSRVLTNLLLLKAGYAYVPYVSHEKFIEERKSEYYLALRRSQKTLKGETADISAWLDFFLDVLLVQSRMALQLLSENILSPQQLKVWEVLQASGEVTPAEIIQKAKIPRPTINQALNRLLELKKIERIGLGRSTRYRIILGA